MAEKQRRTEAELRREIAAEREALAGAVEDLRSELAGFSDRRSKLPALALGSFVVGFVLTGGIGATARLLMRRDHERGQSRWRLGPVTLIWR